LQNKEKVVSSQQQPKKQVNVSAEHLFIESQALNSQFICIEYLAH